LVEWDDEPDGLFISETAGEEFSFSRPIAETGKKFYRVVRTTD
jgi:hypothetical protein